MNKYIRYFNERFPIIGVTLYAGSLFLASYLLPNVFSNHSKVDGQRVILGIVMFILIFLHLRLFDEHKDFEKDKLAYPERMLSKGVIKLKDLKIILFPVLFLEGIIAGYLGAMQFVIWLIILAWTLLMLKEFYISEYLNKRIGLYLISHQFLVPLMILFPISQRIGNYNFIENDILITILYILGVTCLTITYELGRKTWSTDRENSHADSYTKYWGILNTVVITISIAFIGTSILTIIMLNCEIDFKYLVINYLLLLILVAIEITFLTKTNKINSKMVEISAALFMIGTFINTSIAFAFYLT